MVVHVAPHVVPQVTLDGELLVAGDAGEGVALLLLEAVVHELYSVSEQSSAGWAANKTLLAVTPEMFLMRVSFFKSDNSSFNLIRVSTDAISSTVFFKFVSSFLRICLIDFSYRFLLRIFIDFQISFLCLS